MNKIYLVDEDDLSVHEDEVIYECKMQYILKHDDCGEINSKGDFVCCNKCEVITDNGCARDIYLNKAKWMCYHNLHHFWSFSTRELAEEFAKSVKKYWKIWKVKNTLSYLRDYVKQAEREILENEEELRKLEEALANG